MRETPVRGLVRDATKHSDVVVGFGGGGIGCVGFSGGRQEPQRIGSRRGLQSTPPIKDSARDLCNHLLLRVVTSGHMDGREALTGRLSGAGAWRWYRYKPATATDGGLL